MDSFVLFIGFLLFHSNTILAVQLNIERDTNLSTPEMISAYGYPAEVHHVETEDGFMLELHRIPAPGKKPILLMHGLLDSSATWVMIGPDKGLAYILYNSGYDIWLGNARGNVYSKDHLKYNRNGSTEERKKYWNFSWHEIGKFDLPAMIDYILAETSFPQIHYVGYSQGGTSVFVLMSERPEYNGKISFLTAMAPAVFMGNMKNELIRILVQLSSKIEIVADSIGLYGIPAEANSLFVQVKNTWFCNLEPLNKMEFCKTNLSPLTYISTHIKQSMIPVLETHYLAGSSKKQLIHFAQLIQNHRFSQYNYGSRGNMKLYGQRTPPDYNLKSCKVPVILIYADGDTLVDARDVKHLHNKLPNKLKAYRVNDTTFDHADFVWANDVKELVYDFIVATLKSFELNNEIDALKNS